MPHPAASARHMSAVKMAAAPAAEILPSETSATHYRARRKIDTKRPVGVARAFRRRLAHTLGELDELAGERERARERVAKD